MEFMAVTTVHSPAYSRASRSFALLYAWSGLFIMWAFWACFVVFLANPRWAARHWPFPTIDSPASGIHPGLAVMVDVALIALFGLQHSLMARPWFKNLILQRMPEPFQRATYVHAANIALFVLILLWQPIAVVVWTSQTPIRELLSTAFVAGWVLLLLGALSFGIRNLLGVRQMQAWAYGHRSPPEQLRTSLLYRWFRHPMYVGVLLAIWATPQMTIGHWLLATGMTLYVLIALRYEERDLRERFGHAYARWAAKPR
jgi:methanethiol S-methyltransferase